MEKGLIHLYYGEGKGKTTAAMGLALRARGAGKKVVIVQFLKGTESGEVPMLEEMGVRIFRGKAGTKFVSQMTAEEKAETRRIQTENLQAALAEAGDLLILDEACAAWRLGMVEEDSLRKAVLEKPEAQEIVLTGREPADWMCKAADYCTEMLCRRHPFQRGIAARKGVEF